LRIRIEELETLARETHRLHPKQYQIVSIIGSQSSGKSTLLNALFGTDFDVLNRQQRVGQTTKGIWFSVESPSNIIILDVEGSDSR
jgi:protein SEY1